ncbi:thioesterase-like protein (plasmid) [Tistrella bauzanensis]|jgi:fluoroacetyl-CoA thioesterase|uniref:Hotdog domain-containing protein n=1 Tax=Tistrella arctica TaxID=3133430 RepID=A0ABU9YNP6_9PROT
MTDIASLLTPPAGITPGLEGQIRHMVRAQDLATAWQGHVAALASAPVIWLAELACMRAVADYLPQGATTVGVGFDVRHTAPTAEGMEVVITARLLRAVGRSLLFEVRGEDGAGVVLDGRMTRHIAEPAAVVAQMAARCGPPLATQG